MGRLKRLFGEAIRKDRGFVLIVVLGIMTTLVMITVGFLSLTKMQAEMTIHVTDFAKSEDAVWAGIDWFVANVCTQAFGDAGGNPSRQVLAGYRNSRTDWWYRDYKADQSEPRLATWSWGDAQWNNNPRAESVWMYFPEGQKPEDCQMRVEIHVADPNRVVNRNDWLYDYAPTAAQMANMFVNQRQTCFMERDYLYTAGLMTRYTYNVVSTDGMQAQSVDSAGTPMDDREYAKYPRQRLKPCETLQSAVAAQRATNVLAWFSDAPEWTQQVPSNRPYSYTESDWMQGGSDNTVSMIRYYQDGNWNTAVYNSIMDNSSRNSWCTPISRTDTACFNDPDTGVSPINLNTAGRCGESELYAQWSSHGPYWSTSVNVSSALVPAEALWQLLIVNPAWTDGGSNDPSRGNGTTSGYSRIIVSDALLQKFMNDNPEIAGLWADPDQDRNVAQAGMANYTETPVGSGTWAFTGTNPADNLDTDDRRLYMEAREELVERMAWQLAFQYQETVTRWLLADWWDNRQQTSGYRNWIGDAGGGITLVTGNGNPTGPEGPQTGWALDYSERYPDLGGDLPGWYALRGNSKTGNALGGGSKTATWLEDAARWPQASRAAFWNAIEAGLTTLSSGTRLNARYSSLGFTQHLSSSGRIGVDLDPAAAAVRFEDLGPEQLVFEIRPGKLDRYTANAVYNSLRPGPSWRVWGESDVSGATDPLYGDSSCGARALEDPLRLLSYYEDMGYFDDVFVTNWEEWWQGRDIDGDGAADNGSYGWGDTTGFVGWRADNSDGAAMGCRYPRNNKNGSFVPQLKFTCAGVDPFNDNAAGNPRPRIETNSSYAMYHRTYVNRYYYYWWKDVNGDGRTGDVGTVPYYGYRTCFYPPRNLYVFNYDSFTMPAGEPEAAGLSPRSNLAGKDGIERKQYWRKQFTPNTMATEVTNASTMFRFVACAQLVDTNDPVDTMDDRVYYERRVAGWLEICPDIENENVGALHSMANLPGGVESETYDAATGYITGSGRYDSGEWYSNGMPAYWRKKLNFEGWRMVSSHAGHGWNADTTDFPGADVRRLHGDPRYRYGEAPMGQHDRWYDYRGWSSTYYDTAAQTRKRVQFLHMIDNNMR